MNWSGVPLVHVRPTVLSDNPLFTVLARRSVCEHDVLALPFGTGRTSPIAAEDVARVVTALLLTPPKAGQVYELTGPQVLDINGLGIDNMYPTTVAKIEAGDREVKLDEAAALADLFGMSLDAMLGKGMPDESSLTFALMNVSSYAAMAARHTATAGQTATDLEEILEDIEDRFERPEVPDLMGLAREAARHLDSAKTIYDRVDLAATDVIANEGQGDVR
jgi:hypothetical protein